MTSLTWERHQGHGLGYDITDVGFNYRIDEPRAALALSRMSRLEEDIEARRRLACRYRDRLAGIDGVQLMFDEDQVQRSSHFAFPILLESQIVRDSLKDALNERGVQTTWYPALHRLTFYKSIASDRDLPVAADIADRHLCLPIHASSERRAGGFGRRARSRLADRIDA